jgi:hypothetical protein
MTTPGGEPFPFPGIAIPVFDEADIRMSGWDIGSSEGRAVLQAGRCGDHFTLIFRPGSYITCRADGSLEISSIDFGGGPVTHDPGCPTASAAP